MIDGWTGVLGRLDELRGVTNLKWRAMGIRMFVDEVLLVSCLVIHCVYGGACRTGCVFLYSNNAWVEGFTLRLVRTTLGGWTTLPIQGHSIAFKVST